MRTAWVSGWAVPPEWLLAQLQGWLPPGDHQAFPASPAAVASLWAAGPWDLVGGYSLGTQLLLAHAQAHASAEATPLHTSSTSTTEPASRPATSNVAAPTPVVLLAPFFAFTREEALGGRVTHTQLRAQSRWLRQDPVAALLDFYQRAGLSTPPDPLGTAHAQWAAAQPQLLQAGLACLATVTLSPPTLPSGWHGYVGMDDPLLDAARLHALCPAITPVAGAHHHPASLLAAIPRPTCPRTTAR